MFWNAFKLSNLTKVSLTLYHPAMPFGNRKKNILEDLFSSLLSQFKKYPPLETSNVII